ncbi:SDR family NAD(P)-dependent oxidoreductase [Nocardia sp. NPDC050406]|uniref:SDR family NAD(P)-dependent oxidoreductase n=1 Tax=Nocardia sp. NPDC050406 TaxID=3364318 RepID=UPI0037AB12E7
MRLNGIRDHHTDLRAVPVGQLDLHGQRLVVIGGTNGLGRAMARQAADLGANVTVVGRTLREETSTRPEFVRADLSSMVEASRLGRELPVESADVVVFSQGIFAAKTRQETAEGIERDMATSYLSRLAVLQGLAPRLGTARGPAAKTARVFVMGAPGTAALGNPDDLNAEHHYRGVTAHQNTVAANEALVLAGKDRWPHLNFFGINPGPIKTDILANNLGEGSLTHRLAQTIIGLVRQSPETFATRIVPVLFAPGLDNRTAVMINGKGQPTLASRGMSPERVQQFMTASDILLRRALA